MMKICMFLAFDFEEIAYKLGTFETTKNLVSNGPFSSIFAQVFQSL